MSCKILLNNVTKKYGKKSEEIVAINNFNAEIYPGEFCSIMGPSGCGKSTIVNLIAGFIPVTSGEIIVDGDVVNKPNADRVVVSQDYSLFVWKTVQENVEFGLKAQGLAKVQRRGLTQQYLELVNLNKFANRYPGELSGGMCQRVALARALAVEPKCLLLDEPLAALDAQMRQTLQDEILNIWTQTRQTVLLITHDLDEALYLSDRLLVMGSHPGFLKNNITIPFSRPRTSELRLTNEFQSLKREIYQSCYI